jgi:hypothetical protein
VVRWAVGGLVPGSQVCFAVAAFGASGSSRFTDFACLNLQLPTTTTVAPVATSLSCDAVRGKQTKTSLTITITTGVANAGRRLTIEAFSQGRWVKLGLARVTANGQAELVVKGGQAALTGSLPIRATQGSRFVCEGTLSG